MIRKILVQAASLVLVFAPAVATTGEAEERLSLTAGGNIRYHLKTPYRVAVWLSATGRLSFLSSYTLLP